MKKGNFFKRAAQEQGLVHVEEYMMQAREVGFDLDAVYSETERALSDDIDLTGWM